jgi:hypothetical protein
MAELLWPPWEVKDPKTSVFSGKNMCSIRVSEALGMIMTMGMTEKTFLMVIIVIIIFFIDISNAKPRLIHGPMSSQGQIIVGLNPWPCRILPRLILQRTSKPASKYRIVARESGMKPTPTAPYLANTADEIHHFSVEIFLTGLRLLAM